jgi:hypothetical protein
MTNSLSLNPNWRHGDTEDGKRTPEHAAWHTMKDRCYNSNDKSYKNYGGRGIKVCDRWLHSYENFLEDMGRKPSPNHSLGRASNNGDYDPVNCRWETTKQQTRNRRNVKITMADAREIRYLWTHTFLTLEEIARKFGVRRHVIANITRTKGTWK